jgi:hypothetical protein
LRRSICRGYFERIPISVSNGGTNNGRAKMTEEVVIPIKTDIKNGMKNIDIQKKYAVSSQIVKNIKYNNSWGWLIV